jgi:hypothetical protein
MEEQAVIIHTGTSAYFSMNKTGTNLWNLMIDRSCSSDELAQAIGSIGDPEMDTV